MAGSALWFGEVRHRRLKPIRHAFRYRVVMTMLDLAETDGVFAGRWFWSTRRPAWARFRRQDHLGDPSRPLREAVLDLVESRLSRRPDGAIRLLTNLRYLGHLMNPVSFYYCHRADGVLDAVVADVANTPWNERHRYVLDARQGGEGRALRFRMPKAFHVSPFMGMDQEYRWTFTPPAAKLAVHMENHEAGEKLFDATMVLSRREIDGANLARALLLHPFMTGKVILAIYWQALLLWIRRAPFHAHPKTAGGERSGP